MGESHNSIRGEPARIFAVFLAGFIVHSELLKALSYFTQRPESPLTPFGGFAAAKYQQGSFSRRIWIAKSRISHRCRIVDPPGVAVLVLPELHRDKAGKDIPLAAPNNDVFHDERVRINNCPSHTSLSHQNTATPFPPAPPDPDAV